MGWGSGCPVPLVDFFGYPYVVDLFLSIWLLLISSGKIRKHVKDIERLFLKHSLCFPEPVVAGFGSKSCGQKCVL
jgi:hypothetical protein